MQIFRFFLVGIGISVYFCGEKRRQYDDEKRWRVSPKVSSDDDNVLADCSQSDQTSAQNRLERFLLLLE